MGVEVTSNLVALMDPKDQRIYGPGLHPEDDPHPAPKTNSLEREEQRQFANWCLLKGYAYVWHSTHKRSTANAGCPDFIVALHDITLWIEFKRVGEQLSPDQERFRDRLEAQGLRLYIVYSAHEGIELLRYFSPICPTNSLPTSSQISANGPPGGSPSSSRITNPASVVAAP